MSPRAQRELFRDIAKRRARIKFSESLWAEAEMNKDWAMAKTAFDSILYDLIVIGEAVKSLSDETKDRYSDIPWKAITGMRDILTHEYFRVDREVVLVTIDGPLADLDAVCGAELAE